MKNKDYYNSEGYHDPTAGSIFAECTRKERSDRRNATRKANARARKQECAKYRPIVYICSLYAGDTVRNILAAQRYCKFAVEQGCIPFAAHLFFSQFMDDSDPMQRSLGLSFGNIFMDKCQEIWIFGGSYSAGMRAEYERAVRKGYRIRYFTTECREVSSHGNGGADGWV